MNISRQVEQCHANILGDMELAARNLAHYMKHISQFCQFEQASHISYDCVQL